MNVLDRARIWLGEAYDEETRNEVQNLIDNDPKLLEESFYKDLYSRY